MNTTTHHLTQETVKKFVCGHTTVRSHPVPKIRPDKRPETSPRENHAIDRNLLKSLADDTNEHSPDSARSFDRWICCSQSKSAAGLVLKNGAAASSYPPCI